MCNTSAWLVIALVCCDTFTKDINTLETQEMELAYLTQPFARSSLWLPKLSPYNSLEIVRVMFLRAMSFLLADFMSGITIVLSDIMMLLLLNGLHSLKVWVTNTHNRLTALCPGLPG